MRSTFPVATAAGRKSAAISTVHQVGVAQILSMRLRAVASATCSRLRESSAAWPPRPRAVELGRPLVNDGASNAILARTNPAGKIGCT